MTWPLWLLPRSVRVSIALWRLDCVILDVETGGLDPRRDALMQIALLRVRHGVAVASLSLDVRPHNVCRAPDPAALAINGLSSAGPPDAHSEPAALAAVEDWLGEHWGADPVVWAGHRLRFDLAFLGHASRRSRYTLLSRVEHDRRALCTAWLAAAVAVARDPWAGRTMTLDDLGAWARARARSGPHSALGDCRLTLAVLRRLIGEIA